MKNVSKLLSILLCLAMVIGLFTMAVSAATPVTSVTYEFTNLTAKGTELTAQTAKAAFDGAASGNYLVSVDTTKIYNGNGSGGAYPSTAGMLKSGTSSASGQIVLTYDSSVKVTKVEILCHSWKTDGTSDKVAVNGLTAQNAPSVDPATAGTLTFNLTDESNVVTIDLNKRVFIFKIVVYAAETGFVTPVIPATAIDLPETFKLAAGTNPKMSATLTPSNATDSITWTSSDETIATVENGVINGLKAGTVTITATAGSVSDTCTVTVTAAPTMTDTPTTGSSYKFGLAQRNLGKYLWFSGEMNGNYLATTENFEEAVDVIPVATEGGFYISFVKEGVTKYVEIYEYQAGSLGVHIADEPGTVHTWDATTKTFFATLSNKTRYLGTYNNFNTISSSETSFITGDNASKVDVTQFVAHLYPIALTGVTLDKTSQNLVVGGTVDLVATVAPDNATNQAVTWTSSDSTVAEVSAAGKVTAKKAGTATITVTTADGSKTATCTITVVAATVPATGVTLDKTTASLEVGKDVTLTATVAPADSTDAVVWSTSDATIATVAGGKVTALKAGTVTITAKAGDKTATCTVTITAPVVEEEDNNAGSGSTGTTTPAAPVWTVQSTPKAGTAFKYGLNQKGLEKQLWFTGEMDGYYLALSEDVKDAVDVVIETVEGGYRLAFTKDGAKKYIDIVERTDKAGSANVVITDEPTAVLTWDATAKTFFAKIGENTFYLGTYNNYKTISASNISYITGDNASKVDVSQYVSHLYLDTASSTGDAFEPMVIVLALAAVSALAVLALNKKKFSF